MGQRDRATAEAEVLYEAGDYQAVVEVLVPRVESAPGDTRAWQVLGAAYFELGLYELAEDATSRVVDLDPKSALGHSNWGTCLRRLGQYDRARAAQQEALKIAPGFRRASVELRKINDATTGPSRNPAFNLAPFADAAPEPEFVPAPALESKPREDACSRCGVPVSPGRTLCSECIEAPDPGPASPPSRANDAKRFVMIAGGIVVAVVVIGMVVSRVLPLLLAPSEPGSTVSLPTAPSRPAPPAPSTPAAPTPGGASGERVVVEWRLDPAGISPTETAQPRSGYKYVALMLAITNHGYDRVPTSTRWCRIKSKQSGMTYKVAMVDTVRPLSEEDLPDGQVVVGHVPFEVVQTDQQFTLSYEPSSLTRKYNVVIAGPASTPAP